MIIIWFDDWKYQTRMVIIVMKTDIIWSLVRPAREVGGRLCSWLSYKILKIIRKFSAFSKYCLRNWETSILGLRMVTSRFWNYLQCCQLLIVLEGIRSDEGDTIAGYIAEKQVSQVTIGRIEVGYNNSWSSYSYIRLRLGALLKAEDGISLILFLSRRLNNHWLWLGMLHSMH